jgi:methionyl-tRNA formyltransferase
MRLAFLGTPEFAVPALDALVEAGHAIACVWTQPPRPGNRGRVEPTPVGARAAALGLPVRTPETLRNVEERKVFQGLALDAAVVAAYGLILPRAILDAPRLGCYNIHASLLPRWRGAAPIQRAILAGDAETGVTIMRMAPGLDTGDMLLKAATAVDSKTTGDLTTELAAMGAGLMVEALSRLCDLVGEPQDDALATYAAKVDKAEARIDWRAPAPAIERLVRAMNPAPGAWFELGSGRVKILSAKLLTGHADAGGRPGEVLEGGAIACGTGAIVPRIVQPAGRPAMPAEAWWRGARLGVGARLS